MHNFAAIEKCSYGISNSNSNCLFGLQCAVDFYDFNRAPIRNCQIGLKTSFVNIRTSKLSVLDLLDPLFFSNTYNLHDFQFVNCKAF